MVRDLFKPEEFLEIFIDTPLHLAEERDPKGLYKKARQGQLKNFTGVDSPYETPEQPEIRIETALQAPYEAADQVIDEMVRRGILDDPGNIFTTTVPREAWRGWNI